MMVKMEIVINIPDETYDYWTSSHASSEYVIAEAIRNGTPLPKGHDRLISTGDLDITKLVDSDIEWVMGICDISRVQNMIDSAPTIIEADKGVDTPCKNKTCKNCSNYSEHGICNLGHICLDYSEWCPKTE